MSTNVWLPIVTLIGGYSASLVTEAFRDKRTERRERISRDEEARTRREARVADFQTETLLRLQDAMIQLHRVAAGAFTARWLAVEREHAQWDQTRPGAEYVEAHRAAQAEATVLGARVLDERLRKLLDDYRGAAMVVGAADSFEQGLEARNGLESAFTKLNDHLGGVLRSYF